VRRRVPPTLAARLRPVRGWLLSAATVVRRVIGVPDYERYLAHMRARHPDCQALGPDQFMREAMQQRYNRPGSRCC
jgi:uncharacterized short protein YbdD (DUF466 family)